MNSILIPESLLHEKTYNADKYFNERFPSDYATMEANPNYSESGCGIAVTASDTENTLSIKDPADSSKELCKLTYSNGKLKFTYKKPAMVNNITMVGVGSTEKLNILDNNFDILHLNVVKKLGGSYSTDQTHFHLKSICYGNGRFITVGMVINDSIGTSLTSTDAVSWDEHTLPSSSVPDSVCYGNGKFVSGCSNSELYYCSESPWNFGSDGSYSGSKTLTIRSFCYGTDKFVAACNDYNDGTGLIYSTDGITWNDCTITTSKTNWNSVCYGNGKFVAVGYSFVSNATETNFAYSTDGITWTLGIMPIKATYTSVCYGNGKFVAVTENANTLTAYSTDGINWTSSYIVSDVNNFGSSLLSVCYGNGKFVAVGQTYTYAYSYNGYKWYTVQDVPRILNSICYSSDHNFYVAVGNKCSVIISIPDAYAGGVCSTFAVEYSWSGSIPSGVTLPNPTSYASGATVTVDTRYTSSSIELPSVTVTYPTVPANKSWITYYGNGKWIGVDKSSDNSTVLTSTDGITWTQNSESLPIRAYSICYGSGKFVVFSSTQNYVYSTDGITWTSSTLPNSKYYESLCYGNGKFMALSSDATTAIYSTDGITWTSKATNLTNNGGKYGAGCYGNGKFVFVGEGAKQVIYSTDGITWKTAALPSQSSWEGICYGNGKFVASAQVNDYCAYSTDGITWTNAKIERLTGDYGKDSAWSCAYGSGLFVINSYNCKAYWLSTDGITWTRYEFDGVDDWYYVKYGNGKFIIATSSGLQGKFACLTVPDTYYQFSGWNKSGTFNITSDTSITGSWSKKNKLFATYSWTNAPSGMKSTVPAKVTGLMPKDTIVIDSTYTNKSAYKDTTNKKYYKFSGWNESGEFIISSNTNPIFIGSWDNGTSVTPETSWTSKTIDSTGHYFKDCCYGNGVYLIACHNTNFVLYSTDGITWTQKTISSTSRNWYACCYGNSKYILFTNSGSNYSAYSTDGINWTEKSNSFSNISSGSFITGAYGNGKYVFITNQPEIIYSSDGITWSAADLTNISTQLQGICFANGKFVAVGYGGSGTSLTTHKFLYSTDGITWKEGSSITTSGSYYWFNVAYGNDKFVAIGYSQNLSSGSSGTTSVAYSSDGINWTLKTILSTGKMYGMIVYDGSYFISVASNSTYYMYSLDGLTWAEYSGMPSSVQWNMLRNLNGMLVTYPVTFFTTNTYIVTMSTYPVEYNYVD